MDAYNQLLNKFQWSSNSNSEPARAALSQWESDKTKLRQYAQKNDNSILHRSCSNGWYDVSIKLIEDFGLDPNVRDQFGNTALYWACRFSNFGNPKIAKQLILAYKCDPLLPNKNGNTPLHYAIEAKDKVMVQSLISCRPQGHLLTDSIMTTAWKHWDDEVIKCLINEGACSLNISTGTTILHQCIIDKQFDRLTFLLKKCHCDTNIRDKNGDTILHIFALNNDSDICKYLVTKHICRLDIENNKGKTPLHIICSSLIKQGYSDDRCKILFCLLMDGKVSPHIKFNDGDISILSAVCKAITNGNHDPSILRYLIIDCKCDPRNDINIILYTLCNAICQYGLKHIHILSQLVITMNLGPYLILENGSKVCIMCCPVKCNSDPIQDTTSICDVCQISHPIEMLTQENTFLKHMSQSITYNGRFSTAHLIDFISLSQHFYINVKHECNFNPILIDCAKKVFSHEGISLSSLHQLVMTFGFSNSSNNGIDASTLKEMIQNANGESIDQMCLQNPLHSARVIICCQNPSSNIYTLFYDLINSSEFDLMIKADIFGNTLLHLACLFYHGDSTLIEHLLSTGKTDPLCVNDYQQTPLTLLDLNSKATNNEFNFPELVSKFDEIKVSHPIESYVNIIILGDPGVGKSTLVKVINDRHDVRFRQFRSVTGVEHFTAGIVPHVLNDKDMGRIIIHDLAGQVEYYSSHTAVLGNLLQGSAAVFVIVVSLADERSTESLQFWCSIVENTSSKSFKKNHMFVVASHYDTNVRNRSAKMDQLQNILKHKSSDIICYTNIFTIDCRKLGGGQLDSLISSLSDACESVRSDNVSEKSLYCHMLYDFLHSHGKAVYLLNELAIEGIKEKNDYFIPTETNQLFNIIQSLSSTGLIMYLGNPSDKVWIIANKFVLLKNLNGVLFASEHFKEHIDSDKLVSETGIVKLSALSNYCDLHKYDPDMIVQFLEFMELSHEISKDFILSSNLAPSSESVINERYLFIPALIINSNRPDNIDHFQFGWCLQCSDVHSFFLSQFIHLIILHLLKYTETRSPDDPINRHCHIWSNGIYWETVDGVSVLVEVFDKRKSLVLLMSFQSGCYKQMSVLRKAVISEILSCKQQILLKTFIEEFIVDNTDLQYPQILDRISTVPLYSIHEFSKCYFSGGEYVLSRINGRNMQINALLNGTEIKEQCESVLAGRNLKNSSEFFQSFHHINSGLSFSNIFTILCNKAVWWKSIGHELGVDCDSLQKDVDLNDSGRLERVINIWLKSSPSWDQFITALRNLQYNDIIHSITEREPLSPDEQLSKIFDPSTTPVLELVDPPQSHCQSINQGGPQDDSAVNSQKTARVEQSRVSSNADLSAVRGNLKPLEYHNFQLNKSEQKTTSESSKLMNHTEKINVNLMNEVEALRRQIKFLMTENESLMSKNESLKSQVNKSSQSAAAEKEFLDQFNRDHIQGVTISQSKLYTVRGDQQHSFIWDGYGFKLHVPKGACPSEEECNIIIDVAVGGDFVFPEGVEPVSAIYIISMTSKLHQSSLLKLQHCVDLTDGHTQLCFYRALLNESTSLYHFEPTEEKGIFDIGSGYGELQLPVLYEGCIMIGIEASQFRASNTDELIADKVDANVLFFGLIFYSAIEKLNHWQVKFCLIKKIDALKKHITNELHDHVNCATDCFYFTEQTIELIMDESRVSEGWTVTPHIKPCVISYKCACSYGYTNKLSKAPICSFELSADVSNNSDYMENLRYPIKLKGAISMRSTGEIAEIYISQTIKAVDASVQFNYVALERDHIQGVTISQSKLFTVRGDQQHTFTWDGYGFELDVPEGVCSPEEECDILVDVAVSGDFVFPKGVEPVSAIYIISRSNPSEPNQPSLLRLQHCVDLTRSNGRTQLCFYRALLNEPTPPYHFKPVKGKGKFDISSQYGELQLPVYCGVAVGTRRASNEQVTVNSDIVFLGKMFYQRKSSTDELNDWKVNFIVVKNIDALKNYIKSDLRDHESDVELPFKFTKQSIVMILDEKVYPGWTVEPYTEPSVILYSQAISFGYEKMTIPPKCSFDVYGDATIGGYMKRLNYQLLLNGAMIENSVPKVFIKRVMREDLARTSQVNDAEQVYLKVYDKSSAGLVEAITNPLSLATKLREAEFISRDLENKIANQTPGVSNADNAHLLVREVRKFINVSHNDQNKQRQKLLLFCQVLMNSGDPALSEIGSEVLRTAGI